MVGIPSNLRVSLRKTLVRCKPFGSNDSLQNLFDDPRLAPWRYSFPEADDRMERVDRIISFLHDKRHSSGSNALVSLLEVLAEGMDEGDAQRAELTSMAAAVAQALGQTVPGQVGAGTPRGAIPAPPKPLEAARSDAPAGGSKPVAPPGNAVGEKPEASPPEKRDFFVSYNRNDKDWAVWIAWQLENAGYTTYIQAWDFREGGNFVARMHEAAAKSKRTIAVLSETYLTSKFAESEWNAAFAQDPTGEEGLLLPVRVRECDPKGLLSQIVYIDLLGLSAEQARERLLAGIKQGRAKPLVPPNFPGTVTRAEPPLPDKP